MKCIYIGKKDFDGCHKMTMHGTCGNYDPYLKVGGCMYRAPRKSRKKSLKNSTDAVKATAEALQKSGFTKEQLKEAMGFSEEYVKEVVKDYKDYKNSTDTTEGNK